MYLGYGWGMTRGEDLLRLVLGSHAMTRLAALETNNEAPSAQWRTLRLLRENGPQRVGDLATMSRVSQPGMTRLIGHLVEAGFVERESDPTDARASVVSATAAGVEALEHWLAELQTAMEPHLAALSDADWDAIRSAADSLTAATAVPEVVR